MYVNTHVCAHMFAMFKPLIEKNHPFLQEKMFLNYF